MFNILHAIYNKAITPPRYGSWIDGLKSVLNDVVSTYQNRSEIVLGGVVVEGAGTTASALKLNTTLVNAVLAGRICALAAQTNLDVFTTASAVGQAIYKNGADASGITVPDETTAYITLLLTNSNGAGSVNDGDNLSPKLLAVVNATGTSDIDDNTRHLSSAEIRAALAASADMHDGLVLEAGGYQVLARVTWARTANTTYTVAVTMNRNNSQGDPDLS